MQNFVEHKAYNISLQSAKNKKTTKHQCQIMQMGKNLLSHNLVTSLRRYHYGVAENF